MDSLVYSRHGFLWGEGDYQGVAGFASLHTAIALLWALMAQHTVRSQVVRTVFWVNFALTVVATLYFGWHYIADDLAGAAIAIVAFRLAARVTGQPPPVPAARTNGHRERPSACRGGLTAVRAGHRRTASGAADAVGRHAARTGVGELGLAGGGRLQLLAAGLLHHRAGGVVDAGSETRSAAPRRSRASAARAKICCSVVVRSERLLLMKVIAQRIRAETWFLKPVR